MTDMGQVQGMALETVMLRARGEKRKKLQMNICFVFTSLIQVQDVLPRWTCCQEIQVGADGMHTCANTLLPHRFRTIWVNFILQLSTN